MNKNVIIIGASGHGKVVADIIRASGDNVIGYLDDDTEKKGVLGKVSEYFKYKDVEFIIAIGNAMIREKISKSMNVKWYTGIHPSAVVSPSAKIEIGTVVMPCAVVNADAHIGKHCIINTGAIVEHDDYVNDFSHISVSAKLGGNVTIGRNTWIGIGATVKNNINICDNCMIGAGAVIVKDIKISGTYIGIPARREDENTGSCQ